MSVEELKSATLDAIRARAVALEAPLADKEAEAFAKLVNGGDMKGDVTEDKYNAMMMQISALDRAQLRQMVMMAKMMGGMLDQVGRCGDRESAAHQTDTATVAGAGASAGVTVGDVAAASVVPNKTDKAADGKSATAADKEVTSAGREARSSEGTATGPFEAN